MGIMWLKLFFKIIVYYFLLYIYVNWIDKIMDGWMDGEKKELMNELL